MYTFLLLHFLKEYVGNNKACMHACMQLQDQVKRMLRLSKEDEETVEAFHKLHSDAADKAFGRLFRNPSLFEDIVKTFLLCASR
ncbi:hypothetical protein HanIR_Chr12g0602231 [Helianthus annuus]|nr:hypothetical protein HanIR_Chr12g0602231 [Helianthus annuus]